MKVEVLEIRRDILQVHLTVTMPAEDWEEIKAQCPLINRIGARLRMGIGGHVGFFWLAVVSGLERMESGHMNVTFTMRDYDWEHFDGCHKGICKGTALMDFAVKELW